MISLTTWRQTCLCAILAVFLLPTLHAQAPATPSPPPEPQPQPGAPVVLEGKTLFYVQERILSLSPEERAALVADRIRKLSKDPLARLDALTVMEAETSSDIVAGDLILMSITDQDARTAGRSRQELATTYARQIRDALQARQKAYSLRSILLGVLFTLLATLALVLLLRLFGKLFPKLYALLDSWRGTRIPSLRIQTLELLPAERLADLLIALAKLARIAAVLVLLYFYIPLVFSFFPWTRGVAAILFSYILSPLRLVGKAIVSYLPNLFFIAVIVVVTFYLLKFIKLIFNEIAKGTLAFPGFFPEWAMPTYKIVRFLVIAFAAVVVFPYLPGSDSPAFQGISIFLGVLFSLGSTSAVANVVAGVILTYMRPFKIGDRVKIADTVGDIVERTLLVTRVRTIKNVFITIPNAMVLGSHVINFSSSAAESGLILHTSVTIGYDAPWRKVHELLLAAAQATPHIQPEPSPFVLQTALDDFYVHYELNAYTDQPNQMAGIYSDLHKNIQDKFNEAGVEIMSPHYSALRDGNQPSIPEDYLPKTYQAPGFRLFPVENRATQSQPATRHEQKKE